MSGRYRFKFIQAPTLDELEDAVNREIEDNDLKVVDTPHVRQDGEEWTAVLAYRTKKK